MNTDVPWPDLVEAEKRVLMMQTKLHNWAKADSGRRFDDLFNLVHDPAFLVVAWRRVRGNKGARTAGVDGVAPRSIASRAGKLLVELRVGLKTRQFTPQRVRQKTIPKSSGKIRRLGIPTTADRIVQASLKLVLEPIFEAEFKPCSYGFRPRRRAQDAIAEIHYLGSPSRNYHWVLEADIKACFDEIDHTALLGRVRSRIGDKRVLALVKAFLKAGILSEEGVSRETITGTPQGGILTPLTQRAISSSRLICLTGGGSGHTAEGDIKGSIVVTFMVLILCHGRRSASEGRPGGTAPQRGRRAAGLGLRCGGGQPAARRAVPNFGEASPAVRRAGTRPRPRGGATRQGGLHREAPDRSRAAGPAAGPAQRTDHQCLGRFGVDGAAGAASSRLSRWMIGASRSSTSSIVSAKRTWCRPTDCSFPSIGG